MPFGLPYPDGSLNTQDDNGFTFHGDNIIDYPMVTHNTIETSAAGHDNTSRCSSYPPPPEQFPELLFTDARSASLGNGMRISPHQLHCEGSLLEMDSPGLVAMPSLDHEDTFSTATPFSTHHNTPEPTTDVQPVSKAHQYNNGLTYDKNKKLVGTWNKLLLKCFMEAPGYELSLQDIYKWVAKYTVRAQKKGWECGVRHNLSLNNAFIKGSKLPGVDDEGKKSIWHLRDSAVTKGVKPTTRFRTQKRRIESSDDDEPESPVISRSALHRHGRSKHTIVKKAAKRSRLSNHDDSEFSDDRTTRKSYNLRHKSHRKDYYKLDNPSSDNFERSPTPSPVLAHDSGYDSAYFESGSNRMRSATPMSASPAPYYVQPRPAPMVAGSNLRMPPLQRAMTTSPYARASIMHQQSVRARSSTPFGGGHAALQPFMRRQLPMPRGVSSPWQYAMRPVQHNNTPFMLVRQHASPGAAAGYLPQNFNHFTSSPAHAAIDPTFHSSEDQMMMDEPTQFETMYQSPSYTDAAMTGFEDPYAPLPNLFDGTPNSDIPDMSLDDSAFTSFPENDFSGFGNSDIFGGAGMLGADMMDYSTTAHHSANAGFMGTEYFNDVFD